jgi:hypothetical protein
MKSVVVLSVVAPSMLRKLGSNFFDIKIDLLSRNLIFGMLGSVSGWGHNIKDKARLG